MRNFARHRAFARDTTLALTFLTMIGVTVATAIGFAGAWSWLFDLFSHFRVQYAVLASLCLAPLLLLRRWRVASLAALLVFANGAVIYPSWFGSQAAAAANAERLRIVSFNVHAENENSGEIAEYLRQSDSDVVVLFEVKKTALDTVTSRLAGYTVIAEPRDDSFGIAMLSRLPIAAHKILYIGDSHLPAIEATVAFDVQVLALLAIHPMPPVGGDGSRDRNRALSRVAQWGARHSTSGIIIGDFNATPYSAAFRDLIATSGFVSSHRGFGVQASWPRQLRLFAIPIDHCIHSRRLTTVARRVGPFLGSDHRPLHVEIARRAD